MEVDSLADRLVRKARDIIENAPVGIRIQEWQLDCDWSSSTRESFFRFAARIREKLKTENTRLSATIRLHQIKYADKTGIPPVDRGMLMFYNMDNVRDPDTQNSILDLDVAAQYLSGFDRYPLPLDLALPTFSWAVWQRDDKTIGLLYPFDASTLEDTSRVKKLSDQQFELLKSTYLDGRFIYAGDVLRLEVAKPEQLLEAMDMLQNHLRAESRTLAFFALDKHLINFYSHESLEQIINSWNESDN